MDKKDIPEMEIAFRAVTQVGEEVQSFTEEQLNALNLNHLNPSTEDVRVRIMDELRDGVAKILETSNYNEALEKSKSHEPMISDAVNHENQDSSYLLEQLKVGRGMTNPMMYLLGGDYDGSVSIPIQQSEFTAFQIYCYMQAKEQLRRGIVPKSQISANVNICKNFKRGLSKSRLLRILYKLYIKELKFKTNEEIRKQYVGVSNYHIDDIIGNCLNTKPFVAHAFNAVLNLFSQPQAAKVVPDLAVGEQFGHFENWEDVSNAK